MIFSAKKGLKGEITVPGDKSISHRAIMTAALADGTTRITNFLNSADCLATIDCFKKMSVDIEEKNGEVFVRGRGINGLSAPSETLYTANSGTTTRIMSGILAGQPFSCVVDGDASIRKRPMNRIITPLSLMGADITSSPGALAPLHINGRPLKGIHYESPVASAQVKSSILYAGLFADGETSVTEPYLSRNHTELMFKSFGIDVKSSGTTATVSRSPGFKATDITVPGDISSAAFFLAAGLITRGSQITVKNVGINPTRNAIIEVIERMGGSIKVENVRSNGGEKSADITVKESSLSGITIEKDMIPRLIDEIPVIAVIAACASGTTVIRDAAELKVKESNRIDLTAENLKKMGADVTPTDDGMIINGGRPLKGAVIESRFDHRIAMAFSVASLVAEGETEIRNAECVSVSYPDFYRDLNRLSS